MTVCLEYSVFCFPGWCGLQHDDLGLEVVRRKLVEEKGPDPFVLSCSLTEISGALKAPPRLMSCPHMYKAKAKHMYNVLISSVLMSTWFVWTAFVAVCLASPAARHSSRGRLLMEEIPSSLPSAGQVRGRYYLCRVSLH